MGGRAQAAEEGELVGARPARHQRAEDADAHDREDEEDARVDDGADRAVAGADRDGEQHEEVREEGHRGGDLEDAAVGLGRDHVLLLRELDAVGDQLGPAVETTRVHGAEAALHVRHDLVFGLADDQGQHQEGDEDDDEAQRDVEGVVHSLPPLLSGRVSGVSVGLLGVSVGVSELSAGVSAEVSEVSVGGSSGVGSGFFGSSSNAGLAWCQGASLERGFGAGSGAGSGLWAGGSVGVSRCEAEPWEALRERRAGRGDASGASGVSGVSGVVEASGAFGASEASPAGAAA